MRQLLLLITILLLSISATNAAEGTKSVADSVIITSLTGNVSKKSFEYDWSGKATLQINYTWNVTTEAWIESSKTIMSYDATGGLITEIIYDWDETSSDWVTNQQHEYSYDIDGNKVSYIYSSWNTSNSSWRSVQKMEYAYDEEGYLVESTSYDWDYSWELNHKYTTTYDANGNKETLMLSYLDYNTYTWVRYSLYNYTYDDLGNRIVEGYYRWDDSYFSWDIYNITEYDYDANGNETLKNYFSWNELLSAWEGTYKKESEYDENGEIVVERLYLWDATTESFLATVDQEESRVYYSRDLDLMVVTDQTISTNDSLTIIVNMTNALTLNENITDTNIVIGTGENYTLFGMTVIPTVDFTGVLSVPVSVSVESQMSNIDTMKITVKVPTAVTLSPMIIEGNSLIVAPTPTQHAAKVLATSDESGTAMFTIYKSSSQKIAVINKEIEADETNRYNFPIIEKLRKGIYFVEMKVNGEVKAITKIIKL